MIRNNEIDSGKAGVCGRTKAGGNNDVEQQLAGESNLHSNLLATDTDSPPPAASQAGLPTAGADGSVTMTLHQVNQDGAG